MKIQVNGQTMHAQPKAVHFKGDFCLKFFVCFLIINKRSHREPILTYHQAGNFPGPYIRPSVRNGEIDIEPPEIMESCPLGNNKKNVVLHVKCPPMKCGLPKANEIVKMQLRVREKRNQYVTPRYKRADDRVVGGLDAEPLTWPFIVGMYKDGNFHCGGIIQSESWVITAAHCVSKYYLYYYEVRAGMLRRFSYSPMSQTVAVAYVVEHENYNKLGMSGWLICYSSFLV